MRQRAKSVKCPQCGKRLSPQGLNGHLRFVHGVAPNEATKTVSRAPRQAEADTALVDRLEERVRSLEEQLEAVYDHFAETAREGSNPAAMRRRLVALIAELKEVRRQRSDKEWNVLDWGPDNKRVIESLDQVEAQIRQEIAELAEKLGESTA